MIAHTAFLVSARKLAPGRDRAAAPAQAEQGRRGVRARRQALREAERPDGRGRRSGDGARPTVRGAVAAVTADGCRPRAGGRGMSRRVRRRRPAGGLPGLVALPGPGLGGPGLPARPGRRPGRARRGAARRRRCSASPWSASSTRSTACGRRSSSATAAGWCSGTARTCRRATGRPGSMTSSLRVVPLSTVTEVGCRRRLTRAADGAGRGSTASTSTCCSARWTRPPPGRARRPARAAARRAAVRQDPRRRRRRADRPAGGVRPAGRLAGRPPDALRRTRVPAPGRAVRPRPARSVVLGVRAGDLDAVAPRTTWMHSPGHSFAASITSSRRWAGTSTRLPGRELQLAVAVLDVRQAVDVELEDLRRVLHAEPVAGAQVLVDPDLQLSFGRDARPPAHLPMFSRRHAPTVPDTP